MTFNFTKFWYEVRQYKGKFLKKIHDNKTKDNVTVTSSIISQNRLDKDFEDFEKPIF